MRARKSDEGIFYKLSIGRKNELSVGGKDLYIQLIRYRNDWSIYKKYKLRDCRIIKEKNIFIMMEKAINRKNSMGISYEYGTIKNKKTGYFKNTNDTINYNTIKERSVLKNYISYKKSGSEENTMKENKVQFIAITAMAVALTYVFTAFVNVRLPIAANGGLIHLGNVPLFIMAILFGKKTGAIAGGVGMGLFDLLSGWTAWAPFTFIIVGIMGYVVGAMTEKHDQYGWKVAAIFAAFVIKIVGYYIAEIILYGNFIAPISSVPGNVVQIAVAAVVVLIVIEPIEIAVKKIGITQFA